MEQTIHGIKYTKEKPGAQTKTVRVKFNVDVANPFYNFTKAIDKVEEKSRTDAYFYQRQIDFSTPSAFFKAGTCENISEELFEKLSQKTFKTFNPVFGEFKPDVKNGIEVPSAKTRMRKIPYVLKVNEKNEVIDRFEASKYDLYPTVTEEEDE